MEILTALSIALVIETVVLVVFLCFYALRVKSRDELKKDIESLRRKLLLLSTSNEWLKTIVEENKTTINDLNGSNVLLNEKLRISNVKLEETQKKLQSFSKMLSEIKNS